MGFVNEKRGTLEYLTSSAIHVPHCFSTRLGGVSTGALESLNLGTGRGDDPRNVLQNYRILGEAVGFAPEHLVFARQIHGDRVRPVSRENEGEGLFAPAGEACDALITHTPGVALAVFTADCTPILLWDRRTGAVGAAHAGWRGTAGDIVGKTVQAMAQHYGTAPRDIVAAIGPNIRSCCFGTDGDVPEAMECLLGAEAKSHITQIGEKFHVDLKGINRRLLERAGVEQIDVSDECTACRTDRFWSHRVMGQQRGSMAAIIVCKGEDAP